MGTIYRPAVAPAFIVLHAGRLVKVVWIVPLPGANPTAVELEGRR